MEELHPTLDPPDIQAFSEWDLTPEVQDAIAAMGITVPTPIQQLTIQPILDGRHVIAKAETGTGKTLAFGSPMIAKIDPDRSSVLGLVLCPTRELAQQVAGELTKLSASKKVEIALLVGGDPIHPQINQLKAGAQVVVGTPGRVLDLYGQGFLSFPWTEFAVLDEADEMLEIGFLDDVKKILGYMPDEVQTLLFSATFPPALLKLAREHTDNPVEVATAKGVASVESITHEYVSVAESDLALALIRLIETSDENDVFLVFCDRRTDVDQLMRRLERLPYGVKALHGGYDQASRFRVMSAFRTGEVKALVATDVASRGLDVKHVTRVVNFGVPREISHYTHRVGRTGRAGREGHALTLVTPANERKWRGLMSQMTWDIEKAELPPRQRSGGDRDRGRGRDHSRSRGRDAESRPRGERGEREERGGRPARRERSERERPQRERAGAERSAKAGSDRRNARGNRDARGDRDARSDRGSRGDRDARGDRGAREERDTREAKQQRKPERKPARAPGGFGAGIEPEKPAARPEKTTKQRPKQERPVRSTRKERGDSGGSGFGAGL